MENTDGEIEYKGRKYKLVFNMNVMQQIQRQYKTLQNWFNLTDKENEDEEPDIEAIIFGFREMINEGIDIDNETLPQEEKLNLLSLKQVGRIINDVGLNNALRELNKAAIDSTKSTEKNV